MLEGIRVVDLSRLLPGPYCSLILADLGADVIKVEDTVTGDWVRWGPGRISQDVSVIFAQLNRGKKSLVIDLKTTEGKDVFKKLIKTSDVLLEGFRPGVMDRLGLGYEELIKIKKDLIWCSISGFGQDGPYKNRPGHDLDYVSASGILRRAKLDQEGKPSAPPVQIADVASGIYAALGILSAIIKKQKSGEGCFIDVSMMESASCFLQNIIVEYIYEKIDLKELAGTKVNYCIYKTKDGFISVSCVENKFWENFVKTIGKPEYANRCWQEAIPGNEVYDDISEVLKSKTTQEWCKEFEGKDICFHPVLSLDEVIENPQMKHRNFFFELNEIKYISSLPFPINGKRSKANLPPPKYGEHTKDILTELGYTDTQIEELAKKRIIIF